MSILGNAALIVIFMVVLANILVNRDKFFRRANPDKKTLFDERLASALSKLLEIRYEVLHSIGFDGRCLYAEDPPKTYQVDILKSFSIHGEVINIAHGNPNLSHSKGWNFERIDGGPDLRFKNNFQVLRSFARSMSVSYMENGITSSCRHTLYFDKYRYHEASISSEVCKKIQSIFLLDPNERTRLLNFLESAGHVRRELYDLKITEIELEKDLLPVKQGVQAVRHLPAASTAVTRDEIEFLKRKCEDLEERIRCSKQEQNDLQRKENDLLGQAKILLAINAAKGMST